MTKRSVILSVLYTQPANGYGIIHRITCCIPWRERSRWKCPAETWGRFARKFRGVNFREVVQHGIITENVVLVLYRVRNSAWLTRKLHGSTVYVMCVFYCEISVLNQCLSSCAIFVILMLMKLSRFAH